MRSVYTDYARLYLLMDYSRDDSEFYALLETDDLWETPEPKKQCNNADKEVPEKEDTTIPEPEALDEQCKTNKKATLPRKHSQAVLDRINRRSQVLLVQGYRCLSQAFCQAESMIVSKNWLKNIELDKIKAECKDECCNPCVERMHSYGQQRLEYERIRLPKHDKEEERRHVPHECPGSSGSATSSAILGSINKAIPEATTEDKTPIPEAATEHPESSKATKEDKTAITEPACEERKRPLPAFSPGQSIIQWWASWFKNADEPPKKYSKKNRPAWFSCEVLTYNGYKAIKYAGSQQEAQHCYVTYSWNGTSEEVPEQFLKKRLISEGEEKYAHSNGLHENQDCHLEPDFWQQFNTTNVNAAQSSSKKTMKRARSSTE